MNLYDKAYGSLVRGVLFPLHERMKGHATVAILREMERDERRAPKDLLKVQQERLARFLKHSATTVSYYRAVYRRLGLEPSDVGNWADLETLPFLDKKIIRERLDDLKSSQAGPVQKFSTGGSTGAPLTFYLGSTRVSSDVAARCRAEGWWGVGLGDREFVIWGSPLELTKQDRWREVRDQLFRTKLLSAFEMSPTIMDTYIEEMQRRGCRRVFGYPSSIALLCEHARRRGRDLTKLGVKTVFVTAEFLWDHWRQLISQAFGCPVANGYGGRDSGFIAHECPHAGMHITADRLIVEIIGEQGQRVGPGELGEIVVTHLDTPEMPFIRYRTGDIGALSAEPCSCGRTLPLLQRIEGRKSDFIVAPDGRVLHGLSLIYVLRSISGIEQFRITQKDLDEFCVELVTGDEFKRESEDRIRDEFRKRLRAPVNVRLQYSAAIPPHKNGKFRYVISELGERSLELTSTGN
jgi:phenylacetate-CoA ligase